MVSLINPILALVATGHAFDKHVLGNDGGDTEFKNRRYGQPLNISSVKDAAKMLQDIILDKKNTTIAYNSDDGFLQLVNTSKNVLVAINERVGGGDCGTFMRPINPSNDPNIGLDCLMRKVDSYSSARDNCQISSDPKVIAEIVEKFTNDIRPSAEAIERLKTPEVQAVYKALTLREKGMKDRAQAQEADKAEQGLANAFIKHAKHANKDDYEIVKSGDGGCAITYIAKDDVKEIQLNEKHAKRVFTTLGLSV